MRHAFRDMYIPRASQKLPYPITIAADADLLSFYINGDTDQRQYRDSAAGSGLSGIEAEVGSYPAGRYILVLRL